MEKLEVEHSLIPHHHKDISIEIINIEENWKIIYLLMIHPNHRGLSLKACDWSFSSGSILYFLTIRSKIKLNKVNAIARPWAPPFGIEKEYMIANTIHVKACVRFRKDFLIHFFFEINAIPNIAIAGYIVNKTNWSISIPLCVNF